ncbi:hypothetical protein CEXT_614621 [Caerostris extrusa]|uniref:Uncharacterized protein n=1 Tax=Caerostris extrusa TaxID=172846 RepID=A0AAV4VNN9_CAEEX|nr:hypothetical protein CEXT_614621 [Caerostris extrusa]
MVPIREDKIEKPRLVSIHIRPCELEPSRRIPGMNVLRNIDGPKQKERGKRKNRSQHIYHPLRDRKFQKLLERSRNHYQRQSPKIEKYQYVNGPLTKVTWRMTVH